MVEPSTPTLPQTGEETARELLAGERTAWLLESGESGSPMWAYLSKPDYREAGWKGSDMTRPIMWVQMTRDANEAIGFPRKEDAESFLAMLTVGERNIGWLTPTEHVFVGAPQTANGCWATPLTEGIHQRCDDSFFFVGDLAPHEGWYWENFQYVGDEPEPASQRNGPFATAADAARAGWMNLTPISALGPPPTEVREGPTNAMIAAGERVLIDRSVRDPEGKWWGYAKKVWLAMEAERLGS